MTRLIKLAVSLLVRAWDLVSGLGGRLIGREARPACVVLYYHAIEADQRERFGWQMDEVLRLSRPAAADLRAAPNGAARYCAVTFDDGFVSVVENALPELEHRQIPSTVFIPTGNLGSRPAWIKDPGARAYQQVIVSPDQLRVLNERALVTIGSHSVTHPNFLKLTPAEANRELTQSKTELEAIVGRKIALFSFPHGAHNHQIIELARAAGYERVFTINPESMAPDTNAFVWGRVLADPSDWSLEFRLKVLGAYRWLAKRSF